jgi:hypothetical protein
MSDQRVFSNLYFRIKRQKNDSDESFENVKSLIRGLFVDLCHSYIFHCEYTDEKEYDTQYRGFVQLKSKSRPSSFSNKVRRKVPLIQIECGPMKENQTYKQAESELRNCSLRRLRGPWSNYAIEKQKPQDTKQANQTKLNEATVVVSHDFQNSAVSSVRNNNSKGVIVGDTKEDIGNRQESLIDTKICDLPADDGFGNSDTARLLFKIIKS